MFQRDECSLTAEEIEQKAQSLLGEMSLREKVWLLNGNWDPLHNLRKHRTFYNPTPIATNGLPRLGIEPIKFSDGPRGVTVGCSTCFPVSMARGASFDPALERRVGDAMGKEARAQGANLLGAVCINLLRHPAWGRAQETYGEDPHHVGEMGAALTQGIQAHNVMACAKHYAVNNIENSRFYVDVQADDRTMHEVYLPHFKRVVDAGAASVMGAYNRFRGEQACESRWLLTEVLREQWGFEGFTISDFLYGIRDGVKAIEAGMDVEMPMPIAYQQKLLSAVEQGHVAESVVDRAVLRVLRTLLVFENTPDPQVYGPEIVACREHCDLAREVAEKSMVLIKNEVPVLPFGRGVKRVLLLGALAAQANTGDRGSSRINPPYVITPLEGIRRFLGKEVEVLHRDERQVAEAQRLAKEVDCVVIVAGCDYNDEGEYLSPDAGAIAPLADGFRNMGRPLVAAMLRGAARLAPGRPRQGGLALGGDRQSLGLKAEHAALIQAVGGINPNTVVCLVGGSMILLEEWAARVPALLHTWYAGMEGGTALARVLFGEVNPSGRLPFSIPQRAEDLPYFSSTDREIAYDRYHGYTLLDKRGVKPAYPFGFGLSYTTFAYSDLRVEREADALLATVRVANTGKRAGEEVVQVYVGVEGSAVDRPRKLLKAFKKVLIGAGEMQEVSMHVELDDLRIYVDDAQGWRLEPGRYVVMVGPWADEALLLVGRVDLR